MTRLFLATALACTAACASLKHPAPGANITGDLPLQMTVRGSSYAGSATLTRMGEAASGTFAVKGPIEVKGTLAGRVSAKELTLELSYQTQQGCKGTMKLTGPVGRTAVVEGTTDAQDSCIGAMSGTFKLGKP